MLKRSLSALLICGACQTAAADDSLLRYNNLNIMPAELYPSSSHMLQLASAEDVGSRQNLTITKKEKKEPYEDRWFTGKKVHQYLGLGSMALAILTVLSPKEEGGPHEYFANGAAALGVGAVGSGLVVHWDDFSLSNGIKDPDNQHIMLSSIGALGFLMAVSAAPDSEHSGYGSVGGVSMAMGIKVTW